MSERPGGHTSVSATRMRMARPCSTGRGHWKRRWAGMTITSDNPGGIVQQQFDAVIIGSGAGGTPIANTLVKAGKSVLILEKGPLFRPQYDSENGRSDFKRDELISDGLEKVVNVANVANNGVSYLDRKRV